MSADHICANCGKRPGTIRWGDTLSLTHGFMVMWCDVCAYTTQLDHARERAKEIPELERKLAEALAT